MAIVHVTVSRVANQADTGETMPALASQPEVAETINSSGTSQATSIVVPDQGERSLFWTVAALGPVWVRFDTDPTAVAGQGYLVPAGATANFSAVVGHKCAIKDAA